MTYVVESGHSSSGIFWERRGSGPNLTLVIGFGQDSSAWQLVADTLQRSFTLIAIDNRGAGRSPNRAEALSLDDLAEDAIGVLDELGVDRTAIAGHSMGGAIAQLVAIHRPSLISELILVNSFATLAPGPRLAFEAIYGLLIHGASLEDVIANLSPWIYAGEFLEKPGHMDQLVAAAAENPYPQPVHSYRAQLDAINAFNSLDLLAGISQPTLVVGGVADLVANPDSTRVLATGISGSTTQFLATGHASHIEAPDELAAAITAFLLDNE